MDILSVPPGKYASLGFPHPIDHKPRGRQGRVPSEKCEVVEPPLSEGAGGGGMRESSIP